MVEDDVAFPTWRLAASSWRLARITRIRSRLAAGGWRLVRISRTPSGSRMARRQSRVASRQSRLDLYRRVQQLENAFRRRHRGLEDVELLRHVADRPEEPAGIQQECDQRPDRQRTLQRPAPTEPDDERSRQRTDHLDGRIEHGVEEN